MKTKVTLVIMSAICSMSSCSASSETPAETPAKETTQKVELPAGKAIFRPEDMKGMDLQSPNSRWSYHRMDYTDDLVFFWEKGFGNDLKNPPQLEGQPMKVDLENLKDRVQAFYTFFRDTLGFVKSGELRTESLEFPTGLQTGSEPRVGSTAVANSSLFTLHSSLSKADQYRMMVMINYSLDGTAYGGTYDNFIGALWVAPNRLQDPKQNVLAHELGHSFQLQIPADSVGDAWGGSGFFEMTSQWMLWQVNPDWLTDENYHFEAFRQLTHKAYLHLDNIYHSPYVIQWWSDLHGRKSIAELYRQGRIGEDPVMTYKRMYGLSQQQFCDEMFRGYQHLVNFDFKHARKETRQYACTFETKCHPTPNPSPKMGGEWLRPENNSEWLCPENNSEWLCPENYPEEYGFNAILLDSLIGLKNSVGTPRPFKGRGRGWGAPGSTVNLHLRGDHLRYGFVGITTGDEEIYSEVNATTFTVPKGKQLKHLYLIVMGAPEKHYMIPMPTEENPEPPKAELQQFPYSFRITIDDENR